MGAKGRRRREKNYLAAHGGHSRLPPPPDPSQVDALPFKLRKIISITSHNESAKPSKSSEEKRPSSDADKKIPSADAIVSVDEGDDGDTMASLHTNRDKKRTKKRKRKQVNDLRFETSMEMTKTSEKKRERRKKYLEAKKKKRKTSRTENLDFPGRELIKFGDVVQAPPKLVFKNVPDASQERVRLKAIEAYRKRKGWTSRPGLQLPNVTATPSL
ncbi:conserved hypothetical protein [Ricinus communis]|uniref:Uncharacterized protein n=1 Tax=Ricinus communis TaxID=3988 RepID=B9RDF8_RICCO|nr:conserved hypothetical protein [Ricinus communis]